MRALRTTFLFLFLTLLFPMAPFGCTTSSPDSTDTTDSAPGTTDASDAREECTPLPTPIIAIHGFLASGDTWSQHARRFASLGHCEPTVHAFDWNTMNETVWNVGEREMTETSALEGLDAFVAEVLSQSSTEKVHLVGHSAGGGIATTWLSDPDRAALVERYVHVGSVPLDGPAGPEGEIPTLQLWSDGDLIIEDKGDIPGAVNVNLDPEDHYEVATSDASFKALHEHLLGFPPANAALQEEETILLSGRAITFAENRPLPSTITLHALDPQTGERQPGSIQSTVTTPDGQFDGLIGSREFPMEFHIVPDDGTLPIHYFHEPFHRSDPLVYLRGLPGPGSLAGLLLANLPLSETQASLIIFSASKALVAGKDSLKLNEVELLTEEIAPASNTTIALFLQDDDEDQESSWEPIALFTGFPFLAGLDVSLPVDESPFELNLNGRILRLKPWPSLTTGPMVVVFD